MEAILIESCDLWKIALMFVTRNLWQNKCQLTSSRMRAAIIRTIICQAHAMRSTLTSSLRNGDNV